jgi:hypothetical protein
VKTRLVLVLALVSLAALCHAEPRWCAVTGRDSSNKFFYPPVARAARVSGIVVGRLFFLPDGKMQKFEPISGPSMLAGMLDEQLGVWTLRTDVSGSELCQTIVIAEFDLKGIDQSKNKRVDTSKWPTVMRLHVATSPMPIEPDVNEYSSNSKQ